MKIKAGLAAVVLVFCTGVAQAGDNWVGSSMEPAAANWIRVERVEVPKEAKSNTESSLNTESSSNHAPGWSAMGGWAPAGATADTLSTLLAVNSGRFVEGNSLMPGSPEGIILAGAAKFALAAWMERECNVVGTTVMGTLWNGVAAHNLALYAGASSGGAVGVGLLVGGLIYANAFAGGRGEEKRLACLKSREAAQPKENWIKLESSSTGERSRN